MPEMDEVRHALIQAFSGDEFEENYHAAPGEEGQWAWARFLDSVTDEGLSRPKGAPSAAPTAVREPGVGADPILLEPGDRIRLVIEGTVEEMREGFLGLMPVIRTDAGLLFEPNNPTLGAARIERYAPEPRTDQADATPNQPTSQPTSQPAKDPS